MLIVAFSEKFHWGFMFIFGLFGFWFYFSHWETLRKKKLSASRTLRQNLRRVTWFTVCVNNAIKDTSAKTLNFTRQWNCNWRQKTTCNIVSIQCFKLCVCDGAREVDTHCLRDVLCNGDRGQDTNIIHSVVCNYLWQQVILNNNNTNKHWEFTTQQVWYGASKSADSSVSEWNEDSCSVVVQQIVEFRSHMLYEAAHLCEAGQHCKTAAVDLRHDFIVSNNFAPSGRTRPKTWEVHKFPVRNHPTLIQIWKTFSFSNCYNGLKSCLKKTELVTLF